MFYTLLVQICQYSAQYETKVNPYWLNLKYQTDSEISPWGKETNNYPTIFSDSNRISTKHIFSLLKLHRASIWLPTASFVQVQAKFYANIDFVFRFAGCPLFWPVFNQEARCGIVVAIHRGISWIPWIPLLIGTSWHCSIVANVAITTYEILMRACQCGRQSSTGWHGTVEHMGEWEMMMYNIQCINAWYGRCQQERMQD